MGTNRAYSGFPGFRSSRQETGDWYEDGETPVEICLFCGATVAADSAVDSLCDQCESPVARAVRQPHERSARRSLRRIDQHVPLTVLTDWRNTAPIDGMMQNLSLNGMRFEARQRFETNQLIRIDCEQCRALARVTHCNPADGGAFSTGVEFVTVRFASAEGSRGEERS